LRIEERIPTLTTEKKDRGKNSISVKTPREKREPPCVIQPAKWGGEMSGKYQELAKRAHLIAGETYSRSLGEEELGRERFRAWTLEARGGGAIPVLTAHY